MNKLEFTNRNIQNLNNCICSNGKVELMKFINLSNRLFDSLNNTNDNLIVIEDLKRLIILTIVENSMIDIDNTGQEKYTLNEKQFSLLVENLTKNTTEWFTK